MKQLSIVITQDYRQRLSPTNLADYGRLFTWIYWRPQALREYIELHAKQSDSSAYRRLRVMTGVLWALGMLATAYLGGMLYLARVGALTASRQTWYWIPAIMTSLFSVLLAVVLLQIYDERDTRWGYGTRCTRLLIWPTVGVYAVVLAFGYLRILPAESVPVREMMLLYFIMGLFGGLMYSQVAACQRIGGPHILFTLVVALLLSLPAVGIAFVTELVVPPWDPEPGFRLRLPLVLLASFTGFMFVAPRFDNWLYAWIRTQSPLWRQKFIGPIARPPDQAVPTKPTNVYPPTISYLPLPSVDKALAALPTEPWTDAVTNAALVWANSYQHRAVAAYLHRQIDIAPQSQQAQRLALVTRQTWPWHGSPLLAHAGNQRPSAVVKSALMLYKPQDQTRKGKVEGFVSQGFILSEICNRANSIDEAMDMIADAALDDEGLSPLKALDALKRLYGGTGIIGSQEFGYDEKLLRRIGVPDHVRDKASWDVIDEMLWIFRYAWLVNRCQDLEHRVKGAEEVRTLLAVQKVRVKDTQEIDDCVRKFLLQVIDKWRNDMTLVIAAGAGFTVQKYVVPVELLESEDPPAEQATKRRSRKRDQMQPNPYDYDEPIRDRAKLRSRDREMYALRDAWNAEHLQVVEITAPVLCGSTSLFLAMANKYRIQKKFDVDVAHVSIGHLTSDAKSIEKLANGLYDELRIRTGVQQENTSLAGEPMRGLENMIRLYCKDSRRLVVGFDDIDHLEQVLEQHDNLQRFLQFIFHLNEMIPNFGVVLIGTIDRADMYRRLRAHTTRFAKPISLRPIGSRGEPEQVEQLLNAPTDTFLPRWTSKAVDFVLELSGGVPYLVQLLAWNVYDQFQDKYKYPDPKLKRGSGGFIHDPLFTEQAVEAVLGVSMFRLGWRYYVHRLERYFGNTDWEFARQVLDRYANDLVLVVRATDFNPVNPDDRSLLDCERALDILKRLKTQCVLDEPSDGAYSLRIGLMHPTRREKYRIDEEDDPAEGD